MAKYRKKPIVVEAYQTDEPLEIETPEGTMHASAGDWIITGVAGEIYPCKPVIFAATYEPVEPQPVPVPLRLQTLPYCLKCDGVMHADNTEFTADGKFQHKCED